MNMIKTSKRLKNIPSSPIRELVPYAIQAKQQGVKVYHLNIGDPDIKTPDVMIKAIRNWNTNPIGYENSQGNKKLINALVSYYHSCGYSILKPEHIQITIGGSEAIAMAFYAVADQNEEIIIFEPFFTAYNSFSKIHDIKLTPIITHGKNGYHLPNREMIEKVVAKKTRAIFICNPNNPTGTVYTKEEMDMLVGIAKKYNLYLISDEVYREFIYDGRKHISLLDYATEIPHQIIILDSMSKRTSLCGARIGMFVSLNKEIMSGVLHYAMARLSAGTIDQYIASKLAEVPQSYFNNVREEYKKRRDIAFSLLSSIKGVTVIKPEGAFYISIGLPIKDASHFCKWLLTDFRDHNETVMLAPLSGFYASKNAGKNEIRIAYVIEEKSLSRALELIRMGLKAYQTIFQ